jgi:hypothetical protein
VECPFPGMDPYLEDPALWLEFHRRLVETVRQTISPGLSGDRYRLTLGQRRYATCQEEYLEVCRSSDGGLVTLVEVVSPANKTTEAGRQAYLADRQEAIACRANTVEIDLLRQGEPTLTYSREGLPDWDYTVTVARATQPERYELYTATLQKRLPRFRLPLDADDRDAVLDLQHAFSRCYTEGGYAGRIDYGRDPPVALTGQDRRWLDGVLKSQGLRGPLPPHEEVARAAYALWEREGRPHGRDKEHWHRALAEVRRRST